MVKTNLDDCARHVVTAVAEAVGSDPGLQRPGGVRVLTDLYLRTRDRLAQLGPGLRPEDAAHDLALTLYLAWQVEEGAPGPEDMDTLEGCVERVLRQLPLRS